ncbi:MAG: efflux RND transporter permease subunit [Planctomycetota bacterium]
MNDQSLLSRIARFALDRKVTMFMILLTVLAVGLVSSYRLPLEMNPRGLEGYFIQVHVRWNVGVPPETLDKIGLPLEEELSSVRGVKSIETSGFKWGSWVRLRFKHGTDMDVAYREVRDRVERARTQFPEGVEKPGIYKHEPGAEPVVSFRIAYDENSDYYDIINRHIVAPIQRIDGVADVNFRIHQREIRIEIDKDKADSHGISIHQVSQLLRADNFTLASGFVVDGGKKYSLKSRSAFENIDAIRHIPVSPDLYLKDVATVSYEPEETEQLYRYNSQPANGISVLKEGTANTVEVSRRVIAAIEKMKKDPKLAGFDLSVYDNKGEEIVERLDTLIDNGKIGAILAALVLFFFLRQFRMTMVISLAIPFCILIALTIMFFADKTLNGLTIMGLVICVGLLVDNSVVVAENIHRLFDSGLSRKQACLRGISEIGFAITIATLTTLIVFGSALLFSGKLRFMVQNMSLPVISSIIASLILAIAVIPLAVYLTLPEKKPMDESGKERTGAVAGALSRLYDATFEKLNLGYNRALKFFLRCRLDLAVLLLAALIGTYIIAGDLNFSRKQDEFIRYFSINIKYPDHYSMDDRLAYVLKVEELMDRNREKYGLKAHEMFYAKWYGRFAGFFSPDRDHELTCQEAIDLMLEDFPEEPGVSFRYQGKADGEQSNDKSAMHYIRLVGDDPELLNEVAEDLKPTFEMIPGVVSFLDKGLDNSGPSEMALFVDRDRVSSIGVNSWTLVNTIGTAVRGQNLPRYENDGRQVPVRLLYQEEDRSELADLSNIQVPTEDGRMSTVGALTRVQFLKNEDNAITRKDKKVSQWFGMKLTPGPESWRIKRAIEMAKLRIDLPEGVSFDEPEKSFKDEDRQVGFAMILLAIVFVYMLMAFFFESTLIPLSIVLTIPLAAMGAVFVLRITDTFVDPMVYTAALLLIGIVVNNGIVLIDYANQLRRDGMERSEALLTAARHRFRPIVMTALTTICGTIPLTFASAEGMGFDCRGFGMVLMGGMTSAAVFTLLAVPVFCTLIEDGTTAFSNILAGVFGRRGASQDTSTATEGEPAA